MSTTYYVDFDNGDDSADGLTPTGDSTNGPWATLGKFANNERSAGDKVIVRRGMTESISADLDFVSDGTVNNPIIIEADYDDDWSDFVDLSGTATAIITSGSKVITFSADVSGVLSAGDWIYVSGDDAREYAYEVASVSTVTVNLYLPYKGEQAGSGKTVINMSSAPIWGAPADNYNFKFNSDNYWKVQGIHIRNTDYTGCIAAYNDYGLMFKDLIIEGNGSSDIGFYTQGVKDSFEFLKCRFYNVKYAFQCSYSNGFYNPMRMVVRDCYIDLNGVTSSVAFYSWPYGSLFEECEVLDYKYGLVYPRSADAIFLRNVRYTNGAGAGSNYLMGFDGGAVVIDDEDGNKGDSQVITDESGSDSPVYQSETTIVRDTGSYTSIKVTPNATMGSFTKVNMTKVFEIPLFTTDNEKTYTVYFKSSGTANWTADPTADELFIELDYWCDDTNHYRRRKRSTGVLDFNGDDSTWQSLTVTATPGESGMSFLRCWYGKPKEDGVSNIFYVDPIPVIT